MDKTNDEEPSAKRRKIEYRDRYKSNHTGFVEEMAAMKRAGTVESPEIVDIVVCPRVVNWKTFTGTESEFRVAVERLYASDGRDFDPNMEYPPSMLNIFGKDYSLHSRGIYYREKFSSDDLIATNRKIWLPSLSQTDAWELPGIEKRSSRANIFAMHSRNNEEWCKSEYAWEADAWSDIFKPMRDDPCLAIDKRDYTCLVKKTDEISCRLTGELEFVKRTPDATFGLATYLDRHAESPCWTRDLHRQQLERLMLHPKYGLCADPKTGESELAFPFMVYEAKGWAGDCRVARRQACLAAACYLDMLDDLVRRPGPIGSNRPYQDKTSHQYQIFALTSFGAYWHLLVGYRRPRLTTEHMGRDGLSENVYVFHPIWRGYVTHKAEASQLIWLLDQIHTWAITEYRTFILDHLRPWHRQCNENLLFQWDSIYDIKGSEKRRRVCIESEEVDVPGWVKNLPEAMKSKIQTLAKDSLSDALMEDLRRKGKQKEFGNEDRRWACSLCGDTEPQWLDEAFTHHLRITHEHGERDIAQIRWCMKSIDEGERVRRSQER